MLAFAIHVGDSSRKSQHTFSLFRVLDRLTLPLEEFVDTKFILCPLIDRKAGKSKSESPDKGQNEAVPEMFGGDQMA
jgi:hypothetical protein